MSAFEDVQSLCRDPYALYCIVKVSDGSWLLLARNYKPVGSGPIGWVDYNDPAIGPRVRLTTKEIKALKSICADWWLDTRNRPTRLYAYGHPSEFSFDRYDQFVSIVNDAGIRQGAGQ